MRAINKTREILVNKYEGNLFNINLDDFTTKKYHENIYGNFKGSYVE